jgi:serine/threonine protein kinase
VRYLEGMEGVMAGHWSDRPMLHQDGELFKANMFEVNLNHFRLLRVVGKGAFGKVRIVERKDTGLTFALKYIRKDEGRSTHGMGLDGSATD